MTDDPPAIRPRLIVTTDISTLTADRGEPDDTQSMVRLMTYSCDLEIEGLIASSIMAKGERCNPDYIEAVVRAYGQVQPNLARHDARYPPAERLLARIRPGNPRAGVDELGAGHDTPASNWIIDVVDRPDPRPVWVGVWGGTTDLAQALWRVRHERTPAEALAFRRRLRVHAIADQDSTGPWIRAQFPDLFYITNRQVFRGMYKDGDQALVTREWVRENVAEGHGPLGAAYPNYDGGDPWGRVRGVKEGDTPSFLYVLPNGLSDPEISTWGGWGGRFQGDGPHYEDAHDQWFGELSERSTINRWRADYQAEFAARMDWCVRPPAESVHAPRAVARGGLRRRVAPGEEVLLDGGDSFDPDGREISYHWTLYPEVCTYRGPLALAESEAPVARLRAPRLQQASVRRPETLHAILTVRNAGDPSLAAYRRVVITVDPEG